MIVSGPEGLRPRRVNEPCDPYGWFVPLRFVEYSLRIVLWSGVYESYIAG